MNELSGVGYAEFSERCGGELTRGNEKKKSITEGRFGVPRNNVKTNYAKSVSLRPPRREEHPEEHVRQ